MPEVSVVILSYNRKTELKEGLLRILNNPFKDLEIIVVDNASADDTPSMVKSEFPSVKLIELKENIGVAAYNRGFNIAQGEYTIILDDDSFPSDNAIADMVEVFKNNSDTGIVAFDVRNYFKYDEIAEERPVKDLASCRYLMGFNGAGAGVRSSLLKELGGYPEEHFLYMNEMDIAIRAMNRGWKIAEYPHIISYHKFAASNRTSTRAPFYYTRNLYWVIWKYFPPGKLISSTLRMLYLTFYSGFTQMTPVYLRALGSALLKIGDISNRRERSEKTVKDLRIPFRLPFSMYK